MACANCGGAIDEVSIDEPQEEGSFQEEYECVNCDAKGFVSGREEEPPNQWDKFGRAFEGSA